MVLLSGDQMEKLQYRRTSRKLAISLLYLYIAGLFNSWSLMSHDYRILDPRFNNIWNKVIIYQKLNQFYYFPFYFLIKMHFVDKTILENCLFFLVLVV